MPAITAVDSLGRLSCAALAVALVASASCSELLDIPSDPKLVTVAPPAPDASSDEPPSATPAGAGGLPGLPGADGSEAIVAPLVDLAPDRGGSESSGPELSGSSVDAGLDAGALEPAPAPECRPPLVDIVLLIDNSGSMDVGTQQAELALPSFALGLAQDGVDYRIILISRHRAAARLASSEASTSVCVASPLSGLAACPAARPVPSARFFHYSTKLDTTDSFERVLEAAATPDDFGLTSVGWLEWLRPGARVEFVEITDDDSELSAEAFVSGLAALAPDRFSPAVNAPGFIFHSITGLATRTAASGGNVYLPDEPLQPARCTRLEGSPNNAGQTYQVLSRATGGLRLPVCPSSALTARLNVIAGDVAARNASACPSD